ncbi:hypothetical protein F53441_2898 [Fusarium austroafricanum]|uniref:Fungal N-terminal domain-containing protein n=1 Tax=Fusarium austroafricanum TaxID=2364996 RepID=A0A8H4KQQ4_9HYPO|nr:hypothetical protein F53441_2898 [Fusarium austroafricanum]
MGDPLSISTGIAGLISLGLTLGNGLHTYFGAIKDRHNDIETVQQSLGLLQFNIHTLRSNQSKIGRRHGLAADGLTLGVINCEAQLRSLEVLLNELTSTEGSTAFKQKLQKQKMIARYPFDQKKLVKLQDQLSRANETLNNFLCTLILESVLDISKDMEALKVFSEARGASTNAIPRVMATQLNIVAPKEQRSNLDLVSHSARIGEQAPTISNDSTALQQTGLDNPEIELVSRDSERIFEQFIKTHSQPRYIQNTEWETRLCDNLTASICACGISANNTGQLYQFWRGLTLYKRGDTQGNHYPGCPFFGTSQRESSKVLLRLSCLLTIFSKAFIVSVSREHPGGYYGLSFNLRPCHVVESSPALGLFSHERYDRASGTYLKVFHKYYMEHGVEHMAESLIQQLRIIYNSGKSSPFDVDEDGNNIAHKCVKVSIVPPLLWLTRELSKVFAKACHSYFSYRDYNEAGMNVVCKLLSYMLDIGVPVSASNFNQRHILDIATENYNLWMLPRLYGLVEHDHGFDPTDLAHTQRLRIIWFPDDRQWIKPLDTFGSPETNMEFRHSYQETSVWPGTRTSPGAFSALCPASFGNPPGAKNQKVTLRKEKFPWVDTKGDPCPIFGNMQRWFPIEHPMPLYLWGIESPCLLSDIWNDIRFMGRKLRALLARCPKDH